MEKTVLKSGSNMAFNKGVMESYLKMLDELELTAEYLLKEHKTDYEAFRVKCRLSNTPMIDIVNELQIERTDRESLNVLNIHANILGLTTSDCESLLFDLLDRVAPAKLERKLLKDFLKALAREYRLNPYHNFTHGLSVTQVFYYMWSSSARLQRCLNLDDVYVGCLASISHDVGHRNIS